MMNLLLLIVNFIAGSFVIIFAVNALSKTLEQANSELLKKTIQAFSHNRWTSFLTGILLTAFVQSSTAVTILTVGFVDSGLMNLQNAVGIIYGANIGTTVTAQLMSFSLTKYAYQILIVGCILCLAPHEKIKLFGSILSCVGLLFSGLSILNKSVGLIKNNAWLALWLKTHANNPFLCLIVGIVITMMVQSSSATVGLTILLFNHGLMPFSSAVALTLGDNIGSCITAQIASLKSGTAGKRTAWAHTLYNVAGVFLALVILPQFSKLVLVVTQWMGQNSGRLVANTHTLFNILSAIIFLPISQFYVKLLEFLIPVQRNRNNKVHADIAPFQTIRHQREKK